MQIHQFEIDTRADEAYDTASDRYYFFYDKSKTLSAWVTRKSGDKLLIIAYQASQERNMKIVDINELANISKTIQITRNGELILGTKRGVLKLTLESAKIKIERNTNFYLSRVCVTLALFSILSLTIFSIPADGVADRLAIMFTVLLTVVAYQLVCITN